MKLRAVRVENYKSIDDSGEFSVADLTCLAGKNESGKTAVLQALRRFNPIEDSEKAYDRTMEFPRRRLYTTPEGEAERVVTTTWDLDAQDVAAVDAVLGPGSLDGREITISKGYGSTKTTWDISVDEPQVVKNLIARVEDLTPNAISRSEAHKSVASLKAAINSADKPTQGEKQLEALIDAFRDGRPALAAIDALSSRIPRFLYFPTYEAMPGLIPVEDLIKRVATEDDEQVTQAERIFLALLALARTTLEELRDAPRSEELIAKLEGVSNFISDEIFAYWSQNRHLKVSFRYDEAKPGDPPPFDTGHVFMTRVENTRHGVTVGFDERSAGFVWFFSFLVWFSQASRTYGDNLIILLDEPGLSLHGKAQADLLRYIKEKLIPKHQVIYTTHSPFMIDPSDVLSVRTVEDTIGPNGETFGTKLGDRVLSTDADTLFPLRAVLGYEVTQTLFVGEHTLLVEGPSDLLYLRWASNQLRQAGRTSLDPRWTITPAGGVDKIGSFIALFGGNDLHVAVLTDFRIGHKKSVERLRTSELLRGGHVFTADNYAGASEADVEDLLGRDLYAALVNATYDLKGKDKLPAKKPKDAPDLVLQETEAHMSVTSAVVPQFDHYSPAVHLVENSGTLALPGVADALDRFEALFRDLNGLL